MSTSKNQSSLYSTIVRGSSVYGIALLVQRLMGFVMLPVYTRYLTPEDYGILELLDLSMVICGMLLGQHFCAGLAFYYSRGTTSTERNQLVSTSVLTAIGIGVAGASIMTGVAPYLGLWLFESNSYTGYVYLTFWTFTFLVPLETSLFVLRVLDRQKSFVFISLSRLLAAAFLSCYYLIVLNKGLWGFLCSNLIATASFAALATVEVLRQSGWRYDRRVLGRLMNWAVPVTLSEAAMFSIHYADRFVLNRYVGLHSLGLYSLAYKFGMLVSYIQAAFQMYWSAHMYEVLKREDREMIFSRLFTYLIAIMSTCVVAIVLFARPLLELLTTVTFVPASAMIPWIAGAYVLRAAGEFFRTALYVANKPMRASQLNWFAAAVCLGGYAVFIPAFEVWGAIGATWLGFGALCFASWFHGSRQIRFTLEWSRLGKVFGACGVGLLLGRWVPEGYVVLEIVVGGGILLVVFCVAWLLRCADDEETRIAKRVWSKVTAVVG